MIDIIIPIAPYHAAIAERAIASANRQTIPSHVIPVVDSHQRGAGWARNEGVRQSRAPFLVFLDADDTLEPDFIQRCLQAYRPGWYIYTDWYTQNRQPVTLPETTRDTGWYEGRIFHTVTTLLPRALFEYVGGFDESLPAMEDTALYVALQSRGICGRRCPYPLMTYHKDRGKRSAAFYGTPDYLKLKHELMNGVVNMGCCGDSTPPSPMPTPTNDDEVIAIALWSGNKAMAGPVTGTRYWGGNHKPMLVHKADAMARPQWWQIVVKPEAISPDIYTVLDLLNKYGDS